MVKHANVAQKRADVMDEVIETAIAEKLPIEEMPLETLRDYRLYNEEARKANKKLKICRYPIKQCPVELHPHTRVKISRNDGSTNEIPVFVSDEKIHFDKKLAHGGIVDLPEYIVHYLTNLGESVWGWVDLPDGGRETKIISKKPRFSITTVYQDNY